MFHSGIIPHFELSWQVALGEISNGDFHPKTQEYGHQWKVLYRATTINSWMRKTSHPVQICFFGSNSSEQTSSGNLNESNLTAECHVYERVFRKELENGIFDKKRKGVVDLTKVSQCMVRSHAEAAPVLCLLYRVAVTAGFASARCECVFSSLTKVDAPQRRSQSVKRETNCTFLYFEKKTLMELEFEDFYKIWVGKPRKLKFY